MENYLRIPLYKLYYINSLDEVVYDEKFIKLFKEHYSGEKRRKIFNSLQWVKDNPSTNFKDFAMHENLKFSNKDIYLYLMKLYDFMKEHNLYE
jgi:hypothetical protein